MQILAALKEFCKWYFTFDFVHWCLRWMSAGKVTQHDLSIKLSGTAWREGIITYECTSYSSKIKALK